MNFQPYQLISLAVYAILFYLSYRLFKSKNKKRGLVPLLMALIIFTVSPVKFKQEGIAKKERGINRFEVIPERVIVESTSFKENQNQQLELLKKQSRGLENEIHN